MSVVSVDTAAILNAWINGSHDREAWLIRKVPMKPSTLVQLCHGRYRPSETLWEKIRTAMEQVNTGAPASPEKEDPPPEAA